MTEDDRQLAELHRELWERSIESLDRAQDLGLEEEHIRFLANRCGLSNYQRKAAA